MEQDRLDLHHEIILRLRKGRLVDAPIDSNPHKILDIGTGTGIWAIDMADKYPSAEVLGIDIAPIQPTWVPPNCHFQMDDAELEWMHDPDTFDFIHARNIGPGIGNWPRLMAEMYRCTKPDGYVELSEFGAVLMSDDGSLTPDNALSVSVQLTNKAMETIGRPFPVVGTLKKRLEDSGFVDVHERFYKQPFGPWPKDKQ
jgi:ubiquinone/menaquinone biosynthesis C-methylase UbiE